MTMQYTAGGIELLIWIAFIAVAVAGALFFVKNY